MGVIIMFTSFETAKALVNGLNIHYRIGGSCYYFMGIHKPM